MNERMRKPILIGESNPRSSHPDHALHPYPVGSSGHRLSRILGLTPADYLVRFRRLNLLDGPRWSIPAARDAAEVIRRRGDGPLILLGSRVRRAFELEAWTWFSVGSRGGVWYTVIPHPSGRNVAWNSIQNRIRARTAVAKVIELHRKTIARRMAAGLPACSEAGLSPC